MECLLVAVHCAVQIHSLDIIQPNLSLTLHFMLLMQPSPKLT